MTRNEVAPDVGTRPARRRIGAIAVTAVLVVLVACGGDDATPSPTASAPAATIPPTAVAVATQPTQLASSPSPLAEAATPTFQTAPRAQATPDTRVTAVLASGVTADFQPVDATATFSPDTPRLYLAFSVRGLEAGERLEAVWIAEQVQANVPPDYVIDRAAVTIQRDGAGSFSLSKPTAGFPVGRYRVDLYRGQALIGVYPFEVR